MVIVYYLYFNTMKAAAHATKGDKNGLACERLLPDTPENAYTKCLSEASGGKGSGSTCAAGNCTSGTPPPVDWYVGWCIPPVPSTPDVCIFELVSNQQAAGNSDIRTR